VERLFDSIARLSAWCHAGRGRSICIDACSIYGVTGTNIDEAGCCNVYSDTFSGRRTVVAGSGGLRAK
jgi:hypothetical protein